MLLFAMGDDAKKAILARRARFIAAAVASLAVEGCGKTDAPRDAGVEMAPRPCLEAMPVPCLTTTAPPPEPPAPAPSLSVAPRASIDGGAKSDGGAKLDGGASDCTPPYTIDANGQKHYKPDCI